MYPPPPLTRYETFIIKAQELTGDKPDEPIGQVYYDALYEYMPQLAMSLHGTDVDPYLYDEKLGDFLAAVKEKIEQ